MRSEAELEPECSWRYSWCFLVTRNYTLGQFCHMQTSVYWTCPNCLPEWKEDEMIKDMWRGPGNLKNAILYWLNKHLFGRLQCAYHGLDKKRLKKKPMSTAKEFTIQVKERWVRARKKLDRYYSKNYEQFYEIISYGKPLHTGLQEKKAGVGGAHFFPLAFPNGLVLTVATTTLNIINGRMMLYNGCFVIYILQFS